MATNDKNDPRTDQQKTERERAERARLADGRSEQERVDAVRAAVAARIATTSANDATDHMTVKPSSAGAKVTVACKVPLGLDIQLCRETMFEEKAHGMTRVERRFDRTGPMVRIVGTSYPVGSVPAGYRPRPEMWNGYALTRGVSKDFWDAWYEQNLLNPLVANRMILAHETDDGVRGETKDHRVVAGDLATGIDPMIPDKDPRQARPVLPGLTEIETGDEQKNRVRQAQRAVEVA